MRRHLIAIVGLGIAMAAFGLSRLGATTHPESDAAASSDGRSLPLFLESIDDPDHISRWRAGLDVRSEFSSYCAGMSLPDIIALFGRGTQRAILPGTDGRYFYVFQLRRGDMSRLVSHLSHFPFSPDPLEFWIVVAASSSDASITEAKIVDRTAYP